MPSIPIETGKIKVENVTIIFIVLILLVVGKDLIHSYIHNYSFYLSESILFGSFWLLFVPLILYYRSKTRKKINIILPFALSLFHLVFFSLLVFLVSNLFFSHTFGLTRTFFYALTEFGLVSILIYGFCSFSLLKKRTPEKKCEYRKVSHRIKVKNNNKVVFIDLEDIIYVKSEKPYISIVTKEKSYLHNCSLKNFLSEQTANFIQIHKSIVINTDYIISYTSRKNGDYDIELETEQTVRASRNFNTNFKPFFNNLSLK